MQMTVGQIVALCDAQISGGADFQSRPILGVATLNYAIESQISWIMGAAHAGSLRDTRAGAIIGTAALLQGHPRGLVVADPEEAIARVLDQFAIPLAKPAPGIHPTSIVAGDAELGDGVSVGAWTVIGSGARIGSGSIIYDGVSIGASANIGRDCIIHPRCVVYDRSELGDRVILHAGVVIGADGFGYIFRKGRHRKLAQIGIAVLEDDVEVGANTCIDRAKVGRTRIGRGTKIDNLVQVAHNVETGEACIIVAQCGIAGSVRLGAGVVLGGQVGVADGVTMGDRAQAAAQSGVVSDIPAGLTVMGMPAHERRAHLRGQVRVRSLDSLYEQVRELERRVIQLECTKDDRSPD